MMDGERPQEFGVGKIDRLGVLRREFERFEQSPVLYVMAVLRTVVNSVEGVPEHQARRALSKRSGSGTLEHGSVEFPNAQYQTIGRQVPAQKTDPVASIEISVLSAVFCRSEHPRSCPGERHVTQRCEVVFALNLAKLGIQRYIHTESRERFQIASQPLRRGIQHPIRALRIIEAIAERSIGTSEGPVRWPPRVWTATDSKDRTLRFNAEWNGLSSGHESADSAQNLRPYNFEIAFP